MIKKIKIKSNRNNIINYLKSPDLWNKNIYDDAQNFYLNLNELKTIKAKINQIIPLYEFLGKDIEDNYFDDIKKMSEDVGEESSKENKFEDNPDNNGSDNDDDDPFANKDEDEEDEREV